MSLKFDRLFVLGRPASGKSEFLDFMRKLPDEDRLQKFRIGKITELDDFVWIWEKGEEDGIWQKLKGKRLYTSKEDCGFVIRDMDLWDFTIEKFNLEIGRKYLDNKNFYTDNTLLIEFSRGGEKPYKTAFERLDAAIFDRAAIFYVEVSGEESRRRNDARYKEKLKSSILAHKVPDEEMDKIYVSDDWPKITSGQKTGFIAVHGKKVPFVTMNNEPESTDPAVLVPRYGDALNELWKIYNP